MNAEYSYTRKRAHFGRPCFFYSCGPNLIFNLPPDRSLEHNYVSKRFMEREVQNAPAMSASTVIMENKHFETRGMLHVEGGWPREVDPKDEDQVERFRKRAQRDDNYVLVMQTLTQRMEHAVLQNTVMDIYKRSLKNRECYGHCSQATMSMTHICRPPTSSRVRQISWLPDYWNGLVTSMDHTESFIWNLENPNKPTTITANSPMTSLKCSADDNRLVSGLDNGRIGIWDVRSGGPPLKMSCPEMSHRGTVVALHWTASKTEFFTAGADGMVKWWDCNKVRTPKSEIIIGEPLTCLEFDPNSPTKFLVGTANGQIICGSRRTDGEQVSWRMKIGDGPVVELARNPAFPKIFLTVGGKCVKIWSEDVRNAALFSTAAAPVDVLTAQWSPTRCSIIACGRLDNFIDVWDLSERRSGPLYSIRNGPTVAVTALAFHDEGKLLATCTAVGSVYVYQLSQKLTTITGEEKSQMAAMTDRECSQEKLIESKLREIDLRLKKKMEKEPTPAFEVELEEQAAWFSEITDQYLEAVQKGEDQMTPENVESDLSETDLNAENLNETAVTLDA